MSPRALASAAFLLIACTPEAQAPAATQPAPAATPAREEPAMLAEQPKPGERVRQAVLDPNCEDAKKPLAFYYHGGRPFMERAVGDGCSPLYLAECNAEGVCATGKEPEQGMWCCGGDDSVQSARAQSTRPQGSRDDKR